MLKSPAFSTSFLESRMIQKLKSRKSRIKPGLFAFLLAERIIFGKKTQKSQVSLVRYLTFSLVCGRIWQQGAPAGPPAVRVVGRWSPVATVQRRSQLPLRSVLDAPHWGAAPELAGETSPSLHFRHVMMETTSPFRPLIGFPTRLHPPPTAATPSSTQNAPGFAFFGPNRVRFAIFVLF